MEGKGEKKSSNAVVAPCQRLSVVPGQGSDVGEGSESFSYLSATANVAAVLMNRGSQFCRCQPW